MLDKCLLKRKTHTPHLATSLSPGRFNIPHPPNSKGMPKCPKTKAEKYSFFPPKEEIGRFWHSAGASHGLQKLYFATFRRTSECGHCVAPRTPWYYVKCDRKILQTEFHLLHNVSIRGPILSTYLLPSQRSPCPLDDS